MGFVDNTIGTTANYVLSGTGCPENGGFVDMLSVSGISLFYGYSFLRGYIALLSLGRERKAHSFFDFPKLRKISHFLASIFPAENLAGPVFTKSYNWYNATIDELRKFGLYNCVQIALY
jgi:hypothetical protein